MKLLKVNSKMGILSSVLFLFLSVNFTNAQKSKAKASKTKEVKTNSLAKVDNISIEIINENGMQKLAAVVSKTGKKENITIKELATKDKAQLPKDVKISPVTIGGLKMYHIAFTEVLKKEEKDKKETQTITTNEFWEISDTTNSNIFSNKQTTTNTVERQYFDKARTASQDIERIKREGFEFKLNADNSITLSTKTQTNKYKFNATSKKFEMSK